MKRLKGKRRAEELRVKCRNISQEILGLQHGTAPPRLILLGKRKSGKSSFVASILCSCDDKINRSERRLPIHGLEGNLITETWCELLNIKLCVTRPAGDSAQLTILPDELVTPLTCVVWVRNIRTVFETGDDEDIRLRDMIKYVQEKGIPIFVVLTHVDKLKQSTGSPREKDLPSLERKKAASDADIDIDRVFLIKNYTDQKSSDKKLDESILLALEAMLIDIKTKAVSQPRSRLSSIASSKDSGISDDKGSIASSDFINWRRQYHSTLIGNKQTAKPGSFTVSMCSIAPSLALSEIDYCRDLGPKDKGTVPKFSKEMLPLFGSMPSSSRIEYIQAQIDMPHDPYEHLRFAKYMYKEDKIFESVADIIFTWSSSSDYINIWMSNTLPVDFGLPFEHSAPTSVVMQAFILATGKPPVLLTIFDSKNCATDPSCDSDVLTYTVNTGRLLSSALLNHCRCNFVILPCILDRDSVSLETLEKEMSIQTENCKVYYVDSIELDAHLYRLVQKATTDVTQCVPVHGISSLKLNSKPILTTDEEALPVLAGWDEYSTKLGEGCHNVMSLLIEELACNKAPREVQHLTYSHDQFDNVALTVLETVRRLSFVTSVVIFTHYQPLVSMSRRLKTKTKERAGVELKLEVICPLPDWRKEHVAGDFNIVIIFGSNSYPRKLSTARVLCFSEICEDTTL